MKKTLLTLTVSLLLTAGLALGQTATFSFDDSTNGGTLTDTNGALNAGTFASGTGTFTFDINLATTGSNPYHGFSLWLETETTGASNISITSITHFTFTVVTDGEAFPWNFTDTAGRQSTSFLTDQSATLSGDLGAVASGASVAAGTNKVLTVQFTLSGLAPGTYHLETTTSGVKPSEATSDLGGGSFGDVFASAAIYTLTIVPEPATWSLMALGGLGALGLNLLRARRKS